MEVGLMMHKLSIWLKDILEKIMLTFCFISLLIRQIWLFLCFLDLLFQFMHSTKYNQRVILIILIQL